LCWRNTIPNARTKAGRPSFGWARARRLPRPLQVQPLMRGHYAYYGITGNARRLSWYARQVARIWQKWLSRRGHGNRLHWRRFAALLTRYPLPAARIVHRYTTLSEALP
jgi:hypothetical protein